MKIRRSSLVIYTILIIAAAVWILPLYITVMTAIRTSTELYTRPIWTIPDTFGLPSAWATFVGAGLVRAVENSLTYAILGSLLALIVASLAGFGFAKLPFRGSNWVFVVVIMALFLPGQVFFIPMFYMLLYAHLFNTQIGMITVYFAYSVPFATFLMRNYFVTIPGEIIESSRIDGASSLTAWLRIAMPLAAPALAVVFIFLFQGIWNDFAWAETLAQTPNVQPLIPRLLTEITSSTGSTSGNSYGYEALSSLIGMVPTMAVFIAFQRYFTSGLTLGAVKK